MKLADLRTRQVHIEKQITVTQAEVEHAKKGIYTYISKNNNDDLLIVYNYVYVYDVILIVCCDVSTKIILIILNRCEGVSGPIGEGHGEQRSSRWRVLRQSEHQTIISERNSEIRNRISSS